MVGSEVVALVAGEAEGSLRVEGSAVGSASDALSAGCNIASCAVAAYSTGGSPDTVGRQDHAARGSGEVVAHCADPTGSVGRVIAHAEGYLGKATSV